MSTVLRAKCAHCDYQSELFPPAYLALWLDEAPSELETTLAGAVLNVPNAGVEFEKVQHAHLVPLPHPSEQGTLERYGYTHERASREGRLVRVERMKCMACGTFFERKQLYFLPGGCEPSLASGPLVGLISWFLGAPIWAAVVGGVLTFLLVITLVEWMTKRRNAGLFPERAAELAGDVDCPKCQSANIAPVDNRVAVPCPKCREATLAIETVGIS
ncbi:MAG: hypothetical protein H6718_19850 [Polyangiaceae bacterium]|nr:hypothetical protein [Myxococcales bacterium]MCB9587667.1 hypothetical protein [Polyangiaceae bacterium]MCB9605535.1 hypothetical protein [Polyangiaceae bacterium]